MIAALLLLGLILALTRCGAGKTPSTTEREVAIDKVSTEERVTGSVPPIRRYKDATEIPGAIVIKALLDPDITYDPQTKQTTNQRTGESFADANVDSINCIYRGYISNNSGQILRGYEYRYNTSRLSNGEAKAVNEIIHSIRGADYAHLRETGGIRAAQVRAQHDSLERLASFLRAQRIRYYGGIEKGEIALVDRRMDDLRGEIR